MDFALCYVAFDPLDNKFGDWQWAYIIFNSLVKKFGTWQFFFKLDFGFIIYIYFKIGTLDLVDEDVWNIGF